MLRDWLIRKALHFASRRVALWWAVGKLRNKLGPRVELDAIMHQCVCGSEEWLVLCSFDDYEISTYSLKMLCGDCGARASTPTPADRPEEAL